MRQTKQDVLVGKPNYGQEKMLGTVLKEVEQLHTVGVCVPLRADRANRTGTGRERRDAGRHWKSN